MIEKSVTYNSLFGDGTITRTLYFHIYEEELIEWYLTEGQEKLPDRMRAIVEAEDWQGIIALFKRMINLGYGERIDDDFIKDPEKTAAFTGTAAYNALFMELMSNETAAAEFFNGLFPPDLIAQAEAAVKAQGGPGATLANTDLKPMKGAVGPVPGVGAGIPQQAMTRERVIELSGLDNPFDRNGQLVPWAFREPNGEELSNNGMTKAQMAACMRRKLSGWQPPEDI